MNSFIKRQTPLFWTATVIVFLSVLIYAILRLCGINIFASGGFTGSYGYKCGDGTEFSIARTSDGSSIQVTPATSVEHIQTTLLIRNRSAAHYEGAGMTIAMKRGGSITLTTADFAAECDPELTSNQLPLDLNDQ